MNTGETIDWEELAKFFLGDCLNEIFDENKYKKKEKEEIIIITILYWIGCGSCGLCEKTVKGFFCGLFFAVCVVVDIDGAFDKFSCRGDLSDSARGDRAWIDPECDSFFSPSLSCSTSDEKKVV